jgi:hypothetical protein
LSRLESDRIDRANQRCCRDRQRELAVELPGNPAQKSSRDEDGHQHQRNADDRAEHLIHGANRGLLGLHAVFDVVRRRLDNHNGVVHNDPNGQHQPEQRQHVDRETHGKQRRKSPDNRHGNRCRGHQHGAPIL